MIWTPQTPEFETGVLLLELSTKLGTRIPNEKRPPQPIETMQFRVNRELNKHPDLKVRSMSNEYNCVGMVFGARRTSIDAGQVRLILREDGYRRIERESDLVVGDVVVYKEGNDIRHVGIVVCVKMELNPPGHAITVLSQWGFHGEFFHDIDDVDPEYGTQKEFWTDRT